MAKKKERTASKPSSKMQNEVASVLMNLEVPEGLRPKETAKSKSQLKNQKRQEKKREKIENAEYWLSGQSGTRETQQEELPTRRYGLQESRAALEKRGFHKDVTDLTPAKLVEAWKNMVATLSPKPSRRDYMHGIGKGYNGGKPLSQSRQLTRASFVPRYDYLEEFLMLDEGFPNPTSTISSILVVPDVGAHVAEAIFSNGIKSAENLALTSVEMWQSIARNASIWNFASQRFQFQARSGVFVAVNPEYTVGDVFGSWTDDPLGVDPTNPLAPWISKVLRWDMDIYLSVHTAHRAIEQEKQAHFHSKRKPGLVGAVQTLPDIPESQRSTLPRVLQAMEPHYLEPIRRLIKRDGIFKLRQHTASPPQQLWDQSIKHQILGFETLLKTIFETRNTIKVLHLQKVPLLDRRVLAIILRGCRNVRMVGIYDCPLIHYGDVICLLDLIHEINRERRGKYPPITAFDFYPHFEKGMPYASPNAATYGVTWAPGRRDISQRGFYTIILKSLLKSRAMGISLLFEKGNAFRDYLFKVPNPPLAVAEFLDGAFRYLELVETSKKSDCREALYDMLKPIRVGVATRMKDDYKQYYPPDMGRSMAFCACCGYELIRELFDAQALLSREHVRVCSGCKLQGWLDDAEDHLKLEKKSLLDGILTWKGWNAADHNPYAPILKTGRGLLREYKEPNTARTSSSCTRFFTGVDIEPSPLRRNLKIHHDSLQKLPSLAEFVRRDQANARRWDKMEIQGNTLDMYRVAKHLADHDWLVEEPALYGTHVQPGGYPGLDDVQSGRDESRGPQSHDYETAWATHQNNGETFW